MGKKHIEQLVTDLSSAFLAAYEDGDARSEVEHYNNYYLGPFVVASKDGARSIIDGQQRLTSLTLLLIYLNNLQKQNGGKESIEPMIFSEKYGVKSFNIQVEERKRCLENCFRKVSTKSGRVMMNLLSIWRNDMAISHWLSQKR